MILKEVDYKILNPLAQYDCLILCDKKLEVTPVLVKVLSNKYKEQILQEVTDLRLEILKDNLNV